MLALLGPALGREVGRSMSTDTAPAASAVRDEAAQRLAEQPSQLAPPEAQPSRVKAVPAPSSTAWRIPLAVLIG